MMPGFPELLKCPYCGEEKEVLSLASGNTFRGRQWSDTKIHYPMLPMVSPIQHCPSCGKYYFTKHAKRRQATDGFSLKTGDLTYEQLKEAVVQFGNDLTPDDRKTLNYRILWAYNDKYNREGVEITDAPEVEQEYINAVLDELLASEGIEDIVRAEYYRERGLFMETIKLLEDYKPDDDFMAGIVERLRKYARECKTIAFEI